MWTGERWIISLSKNNAAMSIYEKDLENKKKQVAIFEKSRLAKEIEAAFPDAKLINLTEED